MPVGATPQQIRAKNLAKGVRLSPEWDYLLDLSIFQLHDSSRGGVHFKDPSNKTRVRSVSMFILQDEINKCKEMYGSKIVFSTVNLSGDKWDLRRENLVVSHRSLYKKGDKRDVREAWGPAFDRPKNPWAED